MFPFFWTMTHRTGYFFRCSDMTSIPEDREISLYLSNNNNLWTCHRPGEETPASYGKRKFFATFIKFSHSTIFRVIDSSTHSSSALFNDDVISWVDIFSTIHEYNFSIDIWRKDIDSGNRNIRKSHSLCQVVYHEHYIDWPGIDLGPSLSEACD
jgi:hypothetical protein